MALFDPDSRFMRITSWIEDLVVLNVLFVLCCLPLVTVGASASALYAVLFRLLRREYGRVHREFLRAFRENFRPATLIWLIFLALGVLFYMDLRIANVVEGALGFALRTVFWLFLMLYGCTLSYVFALQARFENSLRKTIWNAFWMAMGNLPFTISVLVFELLPMFVFYRWPSLEGRLLPVMLLIGISVQALACALVFQHVFKRYIPKDGETDDERSE